MISVIYSHVDEARGGRDGLVSLALMWMRADRQVGVGWRCLCRVVWVSVRVDWCCLCRVELVSFEGSIGIGIVGVGW